MVALPPHFCHGHNCGSANPHFKNPAYTGLIMILTIDVIDTYLSTVAML